MPKHWLSLLALILITVAFIVLWESPPEGLLGKKTPTQPVLTFPSSYLIQPETKQYDKTGHLSFEFKAQRLRHFQSEPGTERPSDYALIDEPDIITYDQQNGSPWFITARSGHSNFDGSIIILSQEVHAWQIIDGKRRNELKTEKLVLEPNRDYAETDQPVTITNPGNIIKGVGMQAFLNSNIIKLLSRVNTVHESKP